MSARRPKRCLVEVDGSSGLVLLPGLKCKPSAHAQFLAHGAWLVAWASAHYAYWLFRLFSLVFTSNTVVSAKSPRFFHSLVALKRLVSRCRSL